MAVRAPQLGSPALGALSALGLPLLSISGGKVIKVREFVPNQRAVIRIIESRNGLGGKGL